VLVWPRPAEVEAGLERFVADLLARNAAVVRVGVIGSFGTRRWGVGSDVDLLVEVAEDDRPVHGRYVEVDYSLVPVQVDLLIVTRDEVARMVEEGRRVMAEVRWRWARPG
jgi:predicted nucleotidyltransferase